MSDFLEFSSLDQITFCSKLPHKVIYTLSTLATTCVSKPLEIHLNFTFRDNLKHYPSLTLNTSNYSSPFHVHLCLFCLRECCTPRHSFLLQGQAVPAWLRKWHLSSILAEDIERISVLRLDQILINSVPEDLKSNFSTETANYVMHLLKLLSTSELTVWMHPRGCLTLLDFHLAMTSISCLICNTIYYMNPKFQFHTRSRRNAN